ncbi:MULTISPECIES: DUF2304 domain-containing protein [Paenibacillus]|uniref:DUF2304 domain-containing protein n=1 Tax=Paenibacillus albilobatus TaxID=2716884 RepID=A0A919XKY2_9BACL|nr:MULTISPECIES: DUF2304 domain-containing protein [Paenibacillus]GIO33659.1 hypothetical protein J2TS6_48000 [Paenibacillus albilobatus]
MNLNIYFISFCISLAFAGTILVLIRKRKLREQYALLWLLMSAIMMALSLFPSLLDNVAQRIHIYYPPSLLYLLSVVAVLFILLHLTMAVSSLTHRVIVLTQTLGLQEQRIKKLEAEATGGPADKAGNSDEGMEGSIPAPFKRNDDSTNKQELSVENPVEDRHRCASADPPDSKRELLLKVTGSQTAEPSLRRSRYRSDDHAYSRSVQPPQIPSDERMAEVIR